MIIGIGIFMLGMITPATMLQIYAAEPPAITNLEVAATADGTGVVARCNYQNYTSMSGCEIRLYLYKLENEGFFIEANKALTYADYGNESTDPRDVPEGLYFAAVSLDYGTEIRQINSRSYYRVIQSGGQYVVTEDIPEKTLSDTEEENSVLSCTHDCEYVLEKQATPSRNAIQIYQCIKCKAILEYVEVPNSAYAAFLEEAVDLIKKAQPGEVIISTDRWLSFNHDVFEALKNRPDIKVTVKYQYRGETYMLTIPEGTDVNLLMDENGFGGFRRMEEVVKSINGELTKIAGQYKM